MGGCLVGMCEEDPHPVTSPAVIVPEHGCQKVMCKYKMGKDGDSRMGEGTSSICWRAADIDTGQIVAIKVYKAQSQDWEVTLAKFKRQIAVLKDLQKALQPSSDPELWSEQLEHCKPSDLFMQLVDYSKDAEGQPGPYPLDQTLYVVTELADYSLKDYFSGMREKDWHLEKDEARRIAGGIVRAVAGLHAKGLVHLDLKPENLMMFSGRLKLIDVDGCVRAGSSVSISDSTISFSPCYCSPEWARFLIDGETIRIPVTPALDVWSIGVTLCEVVALEPVLKARYASFLRNSHSQREAGFLFMDWLGRIKKAPVPGTVTAFDPELADLLVNSLMVTDAGQRRSLAQCLTHPFLLLTDSPAATGRSKREVIRTARSRAVDTSSKTLTIFEGALYKLDASGDPRNPGHWRKRDMWIAHNGSLCYWSLKEDRRLVLIDGATLLGAKIAPMTHGARPHAFTLTGNAEADGAPPGQEPTFHFACESEQDCAAWQAKLARTIRAENVRMTMKLGPNMKKDLDKFRVTVKNRRMVVSDDNKDDFNPRFKALLWKLKAEGDRMRADDWFEREMWISNNGSLVYWSKKEDRKLVYYTAHDIQRATFRELQSSESCKMWPFQVQLPASEDIEFTPGEFAANSEEERSRWIAEFQQFQSG